MTQMKAYLVGGAVRDLMMGVSPKDRDFVVVGESMESMSALGFEHVGVDFPVFLHAETREEYALARREKKTGTGYHGFESEFGVDVTLEEDLSRRDLTINSMAMRNGELVDPFNGMADIKNKTLRHTSVAFQEDPVRVLRVARLRARMGKEWTVAPETVALISNMAKKGVLGELNAERVWKETSRALMEDNPRLFFDTLLECDALHVIFPEVYKLLTALEARKWHPEGNAYEHTMLVLQQAARFGFDLGVRFSCLCHDLGKGETPRHKLPAHFGHDVAGVPLADALSDRLKVPANMKAMAAKSTRFHMNMHRLSEMNPNTVVKMLDELHTRHDRMEFVMNLWATGMCDGRGRLGSEDEDVSDRTLLLDFAVAYNKVKFADVFPNGETNPNRIKDGMRKARVAAVNRVKKSG